MPKKPIHHVFNIAYNGIARELCSEVVIQDLATKKHERLKRAIWDTGATSSTINRRVAQAMELIPTGQTQVHTANGVAIANTYVIEVRLPQGVTISQVNVSDGDLGGVDMLIGMDIISMGDFTVQNYNGRTHFSFCIPPFKQKYDMLKCANTINKRNNRRNQRTNSKRTRKRL